MSVFFFFRVLAAAAVQKLFESLRTNNVALFSAELRILEIEVKLRSCELIIATGIRNFAPVVNHGAPAVRIL